MSPVTIGIAAESEGDTRIVQGLVDRMLIEEIEWVADTFEACRKPILDDGLSPCRSWRGVQGSAWLDLHRVSDLARKRGLRIYGRFDGEPGAEDARMHRAALLLFAEEDEPPKAVVIARDMDRKDAKRILAVLTSAGRDASTRWAEVAVARLEGSSTGCGLADFICHVRARLLPVVNSG